MNPDGGVNRPPPAATSRLPCSAINSGFGLKFKRILRSFKTLENWQYLQSFDIYSGDRVEVCPNIDQKLILVTHISYIEQKRMVKNAHNE